MKPEDILALLPAGDKPAVTVAGNVASLAYSADAFASRASLDDAALRDRYLVLSAEQEDVAKRGGDGRLLHLEGFVVRYALAPKPAATKPPKSNG